MKRVLKGGLKRRAKEEGAWSGGFLQKEQEEQGLAGDKGGWRQGVREVGGKGLMTAETTLLQTPSAT